MMRVVPAVVAAGVPLLAATSLAAAPAQAKTTKARLAGAESFAFALGAKLTARNVTRLAANDLVVVDGDDTTKTQVRRLRRRHAVVLGALSVGTVETWRSWFALLRDYRLEPLGDWAGERFADVRSAALRDALADTIAPRLLAKGFNGLFLDNLDMVEDHVEQGDAMFDLVTRIAARVHARGGVVMMQNADSVIDRYLPLVDAWNREDPTGTFDAATGRYVVTDAASRRAARAALTRVRQAGVVTTTTDYYASPRSPAAARAMRIACSVGAIPTVSNVALSYVPRTPARCK